MIDSWYQNNMIDYTSYLEDTVWCNDRSIYQKNGWNKDSNSNGALYLSGRERNFVTYKPSIECRNQNDKFTVSSDVGNGKLTYPVALLTADEATLAGHGHYISSDKSYLYNNYNWWLLSRSNYGVRPSISLAPGTLVTEGTDGSKESPFEVIVS